LFYFTFRSHNYDIVFVFGGKGKGKRLSKNQIQQVFTSIFKDKICNTFVHYIFISIFTVNHSKNTLKNTRKAIQNANTTF